MSARGRDRDAHAPLARAFLIAPTEAAVRAQLTDALVDGHAAVLVKALIAAAAPTAAGDRRATDTVMRALERLMPVDAATGGILMAYLQPIASARYDHDIHDAIDLWMDASRDLALADALEQLSVHGGARRGLARRWAAWAQQIRAAAAR